MTPWRAFFFLMGILIPPAVHAAPAAQSFLADRDDTILLAVERVRQAPHDAQITLKTAEDRLREIHDLFRVQGGTPPTRLDNDVNKLQVETRQMRLARSRGVAVDPDPVALARTDAFWRDYAAEAGELRESAARDKIDGRPESQSYWEHLRAFEDLTARTTRRVVRLGPSEGQSMDDTFHADRLALLKALEFSARRTREPNRNVVDPTPQQSRVPVDAAPFFRAIGALPETRPVWTKSFLVPEGARSVTRRENGAKVVFRVSSGKAVAYVGTVAQDFHYGYVTVPPDTPYYFENAGSGPLHLDAVALPGP